MSAPMPAVPVVGWYPAQHHGRQRNIESCRPSLASIYHPSTVPGAFLARTVLSDTGVAAGMEVVMINGEIVPVHRLDDDAEAECPACGTPRYSDRYEDQWFTDGEADTCPTCGTEARFDGS